MSFVILSILTLNNSEINPQLLRIDVTGIQYNTVIIASMLLFIHEKQELQDIKM